MNKRIRKKRRDAQVKAWYGDFFEKKSVNRVEITDEQVLKFIKLTIYEFYAYTRTRQDGSKVLCLHKDHYAKLLRLMDAFSAALAEYEKNKADGISPKPWFDPEGVIKSMPL